MRRRPGGDGPTRADAVESTLANVAFDRKPGFHVEQRKSAWRWAMRRFDECRLMMDGSINAQPSPPWTSMPYLPPGDIVLYQQRLRANGLDGMRFQAEAP